MLNGKMRVLCRQLHRTKFKFKFFLSSGRGAERVNYSIGVFLRNQDYPQGNYLISIESVSSNIVKVKYVNCFEGELEFCEMIFRELKRVLGDRWVFTR